MSQDMAAQAAVFMYILKAILALDAVVITVWAGRRLLLRRATFAPVWSGVDLWFGVQLTLVVLVSFLLPLFLIPIFNPGLKLDITDMSAPATILYFILPSTILQNVAFFGVPALYVMLKYRLRLRDIGLPPLPRRRDVIAGIALGILALAVNQLLEMGLGAIAEHYRYIEWVKNALEYEKTNPVAQIIAALPKLGPAGLILGVLGIGIGAPIGEEMLFRGFAFNILKRRFGLVAGLIGSALLFTLPHSYALGLLPVFLMGLLLAWSYRNSGSLWVPILLHATNNTVSVLLSYYFPSPH